MTSLRFGSETEQESQGKYKSKISSIAQEAADQPSRGREGEARADVLC